MADGIADLLAAYGLTPDDLDAMAQAENLGPRQEAYRKRQALSQWLRGTPMPEGQMVSGHYVMPNPLQYAAAALGQTMGARQLRGIEGQEDQALAAADRGQSARLRSTLAGAQQKAAFEQWKAQQEAQAKAADDARLAAKDAAAAKQWEAEYGLKRDEYGLKKDEIGLKRQELAGTKDRKAADDAAKKAAEDAAKQAKALEGSDALRKEFQGQPAFKDMQQVETSVKKIRAASDTGAGDIALIFNYMKMLDPGSTVREGEFAQAASTGAVPDRVLYFYKRLDGDKLPPSARRELKAEAEKVYQAQRGQYEQTASAYREYAKVRGYDPGHVVFDGSAPAAAAPGAPKRRRYNPATGALE